MAQILFIPNGSGGGAPSQDRFAPKIVVGNIANGDSSVEYSTDGFYYFADPGVGVGAGGRLAAALAIAAGADVWIRPGTFETSTTLNVLAGTTVRGSGAGSTLIQSVPTLVAGPLFSLSDESSLRDMTVDHSVPGNSGGFQYGAIDLRGGSGSNAYASCDNVKVIVSRLAGPADPTIFAGFYAYSLGGFRVKLDLFRCAVRFGSNGSGVLANLLAGYRSLNAVLVLDDCAADSEMDSLGAMPPGIGVLAISSAVNEWQSALDIRGGRYFSYRIAICPYGQSGIVFPTSVVNTEALSGNNAVPLASDSCVYQLGRGRLAISNCSFHSISAADTITLNPAGQDANCTGQIHGNTLRSDTGKAWNSLGSGLHTIIGNCYTNSVPPTSSPNDEVAHNIVI